MVHKLRSRRGETLTETLAAILVVSLSSVVLMTLTVTASRINRVAEEGDTLFREEQAAAEIQPLPGTLGEVALNGGIRGTYPVVYTGGEEKLTSYTYQRGGGT